MATLTDVVSSVTPSCAAMYEEFSCVVHYEADGSLVTVDFRTGEMRPARDINEVLAIFSEIVNNPQWRLVRFSNLS